MAPFKITSNRPLKFFPSSFKDTIDSTRRDLLGDVPGWFAEPLPCPWKTTRLSRRAGCSSNHHPCDLTSAPSTGGAAAGTGGAAAGTGVPPWLHALTDATGFEPQVVWAAKEGCGPVAQPSHWWWSLSPACHWPCRGCAGARRLPGFSHAPGTVRFCGSEHNT